jgi:glycosyltransferase involved in cell wall biosynthesis
MSSAQDELQALAARLEAQQRVIEALYARLSEPPDDPNGWRAALIQIFASRSYHFAKKLSRMSAPIRKAKHYATRGLRAAASVRKLVRFRPAALPPYVPPPGDTTPVGHLRLRLDRPVPASLAVGRGNCLTFVGACYHPAGPITELAATRDGVRLDAPVVRTVRTDIHALECPDHDPAGHSMLSGFIVTVDLPPCDGPTPADFGLEARLADGSVHRTDLGRVVLRPEVDTRAEPPAVPDAPDNDQPLIAVCMAVYNPPTELFERQIESIRNQTHTNWVCIITDDASPPEAYARILAVTNRDPRFQVYRNPERLGFYHNFERCLALTPPEAQFVSLADHDDDWLPEKLESLLAAFDKKTQLVYSDMRIVTDEGKVLSSTYWTTRKNNYKNIASLLVANTITGAAAMFRRSLLDVVLPFPDKFGNTYHDQWIGAAALAVGKIGYVDRPLYDYVQHGRNVCGHWVPPRSTWRERYRQIKSAVLPASLHKWWGRLLTYGQTYDHQSRPARHFARLLLARCGPDMLRRRRRVLKRLAGADQSITAWLWLALRGLPHRKVTLNREYQFLASLAWQVGSNRQVRRRLRLPPPAPAAPPPPIRIDHLTTKTAALNLLVSPFAPRRVNLLLSAVDFNHVFGGYIAVFHLARRLADSGHKVRLVTTDRCPYDPPLWRHHFRSYPGLEDFVDRVEVVPGFDRAIPIEANHRDQFLATSWWTAHIAHKSAAQLGRRSFVFLTQDYEPYFYDMCTDGALSRQAYQFPHYAIYSTHLLRDFFRENRHGPYAAGREHGDRMSVAFTNAIMAVGAPAAVELARRPSRRLLFYARPEPYNGRNLFELGLMALTEAVSSGVFPAGWEIYGIGTSNLAGRIALADGVTLRMLPRKTLTEYAHTLTEHDVGLSLMYTPHPSLVPLEMAAAGMVTVTNTFANKTADRLQDISPNLIGVEATVPSLVDGLRRAVAASADCEARVEAAQVDWCTDWNEAFTPALMRTINGFLNAGEMPATVRRAA